ncbi:MAG: chorismate-binding protein [Actinobacteria bacterium]|nr:chorismate-binding protein [Actinomycetota bacterium]
MSTLTERDRYEWRVGDDSDPIGGLAAFLGHYGLPVGDLTAATTGRRVRSRYLAGVLIGGAAGAVAVGAEPGAPSPCPDVPDVVAVIYDRDGRGGDIAAPAGSQPRPTSSWCCTEWHGSWSDTAHATAVARVRDAIAVGDVYQVNVVGHRAARYRGDPIPALRALTRLPGAVYGGGLSGDGWVVATASPESLVTVTDGVVATRPIKGTRPATPAGRRELLSDPKERAEHVMIVDLARNDLSRIAEIGTVGVHRLFQPREWCGLWQAETTVSARLRAGTGLAELLRAVLPGGSVTGAPKLAAVAHIAALEPVGRGPAMGALGVITGRRVELGLTIRTVAADRQRLHLWAGGGVTWGSDPTAEVAEAHAKAAPLLAALRSTPAW